MQIRMQTKPSAFFRGGLEARWEAEGGALGTGLVILRAPPIFTGSSHSFRKFPLRLSIQIARLPDSPRLKKGKKGNCITVGPALWRFVSDDFPILHRQGCVY